MGSYSYSSLMKNITSILLLNQFGKSLPESDLVAQHRFRVFKITTLFAVLIFAGIIYQTSITDVDKPFLNIIFILFIAVFINYFGLAIHKKPAIAYISLMTLAFAVLHIISYGQGGIRNSGIFYLAALILNAFMLIGKTGGKVMAIISIVNVIYFYYVSLYTNWVSYSLIGTEQGMIELDFLITGVLSILFLTTQASYIEKSKNAITEDIKSKRDELTIINTQLLHVQNDIEIKNQELIQKNKELEQFAYIASHDLQEPLRTTASFVELLQRQYKGRLDENADKYLTYLVNASDRMQVLIKDLLDYSLIGSKKTFKKIDCNVLIQEVLMDLGIAIQESKTDIQVEKLPLINGYDIEIKQLFQNLITNAIKFRKKDVVPQIKISANKKDTAWEFAIKDNGIGINEQHKDRIFVIFQRLHTRTVYEGSGIGLSHCKKIVELHDGKIWLESQPGEGTTFYFTIQKKINNAKENGLSIAC